MRSSRPRKRPNIIVRFILEIGRLLASLALGLVLLVGGIATVVLAASSPPARKAMDLAVDRAGADDEVFGLLLIGGVHAIITALVTSLLFSRALRRCLRAIANGVRRLTTRHTPVETPHMPPPSPDPTPDLPPWARPRDNQAA